MLPVALGRATRIAPILVHTRKEYMCVMELHGEVGDDALENALEYFRGTIYQRPPVRSSVRRALRKRRIYEIELLERRDRFVLVRVLSDPGTYMRKLCHDVGLYLGVGAHMRELRRLKSGPFKEEHSVTLHELSEAVYLWRRGEEAYLREAIYPVEIATCEIPKIIVKDTAAATLIHGANLGFAGIAAYTNDASKGTHVALMNLRGELIGIGRLTTSLPRDVMSKAPSREKRLLSGLKIIMEESRYPVTWRKKH